MRRLLLAIVVTALLVFGAIPALASQFPGNSPIGACAGC